MEDADELLDVYRNYREKTSLSKVVEFYLPITAKQQHTMKVRARVKKMCENCKMVRRSRHLRIICTNPKHKQKQ